MFVRAIDFFISIIIIIIIIIITVINNSGLGDSDRYIICPKTPAPQN